MSRFLVALLAVVTALPLLAAPPQPGELEKYRNDGTLEQRVEYQRSFGNDKFDPNLIKRAGAKIRRAELQAKGTPPDLVDRIAPLPPPAWRGMPTTGTNRCLTVLIEFNDERFTAVNTRDYVDDAIYGDGIAVNYPYESLRNYYQRASFDQLTIEGDTLGWYRTAYDRTTIDTTTNGGVTGRENLIKEALQNYDNAGHDFSQYDNDNNGEIDYVMFIYAGPNTGWGSFWWAYQTGFQDATFTLDGKTLGTYIFQFQNYDHTDPFDPIVITHETGHALGLPDLYDYDDTVGPRGGVGGLDMMDGNRGDHNGFSKWILDWTTPTVIGAGAARVTLEPAATSGNGVAVFDGATASQPFAEYYFVENRNGGDNDDGSNWPATGLAIWHIDATLAAGGNDYASNNSDTPHKLVRLMEADGLEEIEQNMLGDGGDFWQPDDVFDGASTPNSNGYDGLPSAVAVLDIRNVAGGIEAVISVDDLPPNIEAATINAAGNTLTIIFDESVVYTAVPSLDLSGGPVTATYASGSDTVAINYTLSRKVFDNESGTMDLPGGGVVDITGNAVAPVVDYPLLVGVDPDLTAPVAQSATVNANGELLTLVFDESVTFFEPPQLAMSGGAVDAEFKEGDGTNALTFTLSRTITSEETGIYDLAPGSVENPVGLPNEPVFSGDVINDSDVGRDDGSGASSSEKRVLGLYANYYVDNAYSMSSGFYSDPNGFTGNAYYAYINAYYALLYRYYAGDQVRWGGGTGKTKSEVLGPYYNLRYQQVLLSYYAQLYSREDYLAMQGNYSLYAYLYSYLAYEYGLQDLSRP